MKAFSSICAALPKAHLLLDNNLDFKFQPVDIRYTNQSLPGVLGRLFAYRADKLPDNSDYKYCEYEYRQDDKEIPFHPFCNF